MPTAEAPRLLQIAQVLKSNGTEGELVWGFRDFGPEDIDLEEPVFIEYDGLPVPFFITSLTPRGNNKALVRLSDIRSYDEAEEIVGRPVYVSEDSIEEEWDESDPAGLVGWTLLHADGKKAGVITDFEDIPGNPCLYVDGPDGEVMVPLHEDLIRELDPDRGILIMDLPDGLL